MRLYLHAYDINGQSIGVDVDTWGDIGDNVPWLVSQNISESGYNNITSIENWHKFGDGLLSDYQEKQKAIKLAFYDKGWANCSNAEKDIVLSYHANPDLGNNNQNTEALTYLMTVKGMSLSQASDFLVDSWWNHWTKFIEGCPSRFRLATKIVLRYLSFADASDLDVTIESLKTRYMTTGILGLGYGDHKEGLLNYIWSNQSYTGQGLEENGYVLKQGTYATMKQDIEDSLCGVYFWPEIKTHLQSMS